jgi:hypothetical protein
VSADVDGSTDADGDDTGPTDADDGAADDAAADDGATDDGAADDGGPAGPTMGDLCETEEVVAGVIDCDIACSSALILGDGWCDDGGTYPENFNCEYFEWDEGDCEDPTADMDADAGADGSTDADGGSTEECTGMVSWISDGYCDSSNNNESCDWDGGDCCEATCVSTASYTCGVVGFTCLDPAG